MSEIVSKKQFFIASEKAKSIGKTGLYDKLDKSMVEFFNAICKEVLSGENELFAIQWAISKLSTEEREMIVESTEDLGCH